MRPSWSLLYGLPGLPYAVLGELQGAVTEAYVFCKGVLSDREYVQLSAAERPLRHKKQGMAGPWDGRGVS